MNEQPSLLRDLFTIHPSAYIFPQTFLAGMITIGPECSVWPMSVLRADTVPITLGIGCNVQDGCIIHGDPGFPVRIGDWVTLGHGAIIHGAVIEDEVLVGIGAVLLNGARIGRGSIIGARALVTEGMQVPPGSLVLGIPGRIRPLGADQAATIRRTAERYVARKDRYRLRTAAEGGTKFTMPLPSNDPNVEHEDAPATLPPPPEPPEALQAIMQAAEGLLMPSETDAPFEPFRWQADAPLTSGALLRQLELDPATPVETGDALGLLNQLAAERSWFGDEERALAQRFAQLRTTMSEHLRELTLYRVGTIKLTLILVGRDRNDQVLGLRTMVVET
ncbi:nuclease A inhibitor family protein [Candidatus Viridilinea mediisalina]|uniref:Gamma carbonic anhydrase family protein n=1 Tax=Candidatus Viridilinea mediisalina TaxID=2024553 RepID=A0A2A6RH67_9CHLR|nr:nuclease A inhibitor family protein [Candidatus Viridilinea mediisalina]PDW02236.1 hypothetical protein CJ255_15085 [Candidatus Viridilinea mediisalina]